MLSPYLLRRLVLLLPTLFIVISLNFFLLQWLPGGPVEATLAKLRGIESSAAELFEGVEAQSYQAVDKELEAKIAKQYGFDKPIFERYQETLLRYFTFDLGRSYFSDIPVSELILEKLPVSLSLGFWTLFLTYLIAVPLGVAKATSQGGAFDSISSLFLFIAYAIPTFIIAIICILLFSGGGAFSWFPLRGIVSPDHEALTMSGKILDYFWHLCLPVFACVASGLASLTVLTKNSVVDQLSGQYVDTAICMGESRRQVVLHHVLPNSVLVIVARLPSDLLSIFVSGTLLVEIVFSLDGVALLGFEALLERDYPVILGILYCYTLLGLILNLIGDLLYRVVDPRLNFSQVAA